MPLSSKNGCLRWRWPGHSLSPVRRAVAARRRCVRTPAPPPPRCTPALSAGSCARLTVEVRGVLLLLTCLTPRARVILADGKIWRCRSAPPCAPLRHVCCVAGLQQGAEAAKRVGNSHPGHPAQVKWDQHRTHS